jgi:hypothetical protein
MSSQTISDGWVEHDGLDYALGSWVLRGKPVDEASGFA